MQKDIKNILYTTDLSKNGPIAFGYAAWLASLTGADIHILHVVEKLSDDVSFTLQTYVLEEGKRDQMLQSRIQNARSVLDRRQEEFWSAQSAEDRKVRKQIKSIEACESYPAEKILAAVEEHDCDLIVMGSHERGIVHTFLGSVAKSVLRRTQVPVLVVPLFDRK